MVIAVGGAVDVDVGGGGSPCCCCCCWTEAMIWEMTANAQRAPQKQTCVTFPNLLYELLLLLPEILVKRSPLPLLLLNQLKDAPAMLLCQGGHGALDLLLLLLLLLLLGDCDAGGGEGVCGAWALQQEGVQGDGLGRRDRGFYPVFGLLFFFQ